MDFLAYFSKNLTNPAFNFCAFGRKRYLHEIEKIFENFQKFSKENCLKCLILAYFSKSLTIPAFNFCAFGRKRQIVGKF